MGGEVWLEGEGLGYFSGVLRGGCLGLGQEICVKYGSKQDKYLRATLGTEDSRWSGSRYVLACLRTREARVATAERARKSMEGEPAAR